MFCCVNCGSCMHSWWLKVCCMCSFFFFFSSRRRHTRFDCDWSSDVCSSDLTTFLLHASAPRPDGGKQRIGVRAEQQERGCRRRLLQRLQERILRPLVHGIGGQIGRESGRGRGEISVVAVSLKKKKKKKS